MFTVSFSLLVMVYISLPLCFLVSFWFFFELGKKGATHFQYKIKKKIVCPYCLNIFLESKNKDIVECTACEFLIDTKEKNLSWQHSLPSN